MQEPLSLSKYTVKTRYSAQQFFDTLVEEAQTSGTRFNAHALRTAFTYFLFAIEIAYSDRPEKYSSLVPKPDQKRMHTLSENLREKSHRAIDMSYNAWLEFCKDNSNLSSISIFRNMMRYLTEGEGHNFMQDYARSLKAPIPTYDFSSDPRSVQTQGINQFVQQQSVKPSFVHAGSAAFSQQAGPVGKPTTFTPRFSSNPFRVVSPEIIKRDAPVNRFAPVYTTVPSNKTTNFSTAASPRITPEASPIRPRVGAVATPSSFVRTSGYVPPRMRGAFVVNTNAGRTTPATFSPSIVPTRTNPVAPIHVAEPLRLERTQRAAPEQAPIRPIVVRREPHQSATAPTSQAKAVAEQILQQHVPRFTPVSAQQATAQQATAQQRKQQASAQVPQSWQTYSAPSQVEQPRPVRQQAAAPRQAWQTYSAPSQVEQPRPFRQQAAAAAPRQVWQEYDTGLNPSLYQDEVENPYSLMGSYQYAGHSNF